MNLHDRYRNRPVVVLALHDQSIQSREALDVKLEHAKRAVWKGRDLPFRVAFNASLPGVGEDDPGHGRGMTCRRYQINAFPTTLVIGPDGVANLHEPGRVEALIDAALAGAASP